MEPHLHPDQPNGAWTNTSYSLSGPIVGKQLIQFESADDRAPSGEFDVIIAGTSINHADGTVTHFPVSGIARYRGYASQSNTNFTTKLTSANATPLQTTRSYLYDLSGHVISEINSSGGWNRGEVYAGGIHLATYDGNTTYFTHSDWLGTERVRSTIAGGIYSTWTSYPFGEGSAAPNPGPTHYTGKERDTESGLDYFGARYYASNMGRFMSPDDPTGIFANPKNPQSWNLYSYVRNNPLTNIDPDGHDCVNTSNYANNATVTITSGTSCASDPGKYGTYIDGTVDPNSITASSKASGTTFGYNFTSYDGQNGGAGVITKESPYDPLESPADRATAGMIGNGGMQAIGVFTAGSVVLGTAGGVGLATGVIGGGSAALSTSNITAALRFYAAQNAWKLLNVSGVFTAALSKFFSTGVLDEVVTPEALRGYLELARAYVQVGVQGGFPQGGVDVQAQRVAQIVQHLGGN